MYWYAGNWHSIDLWLSQIGFCGQPVLCHWPGGSSCSCERTVEQGVSDPDRSSILADHIQEYLATRAKLFDPEKTNPQVIHVSIDAVSKAGSWLMAFKFRAIQSTPRIRFTSLVGHQSVLSTSTESQSSDWPVGERMQLHPKQLCRIWYWRQVE